MPIDFTAVDFETVGGQICAIGAARVRDATTVGTYHILVNPETDHAASTMELRKNGGLSPDELQSEPTFKDVYQSFLDFIGDDILVAHSASTADMSMLARACERYELDPPSNDWFCTMVFYDDAIPEHKEAPRKWQQSSSLKNAVRYVFDEKLSDHHDPVYDAITCARLACELSERVRKDDLATAGKTAEKLAGERQVAARNIEYQALLAEQFDEWIAGAIMDDRHIRASEIAKHPDKATTDAPCIICGHPIQEDTTSVLRYRHVCSRECSDALLTAIRRAIRKMPAPKGIRSPLIGPIYVSEY